jgi:hypothetical protein
MLDHLEEMLLGVSKRLREGKTRVKEACPFAGIIQIKFGRYFSDQSVTTSLCRLVQSFPRVIQGEAETKSGKGKVMTRIEHPDAFLFLGFTLVSTQ